MTASFRFSKTRQITIFGIFDDLLSTQNVNVARFARNVEWDLFLWVSNIVWLCQNPTQFSVVLQAMPQAILLSVEIFAINVLVPTCCLTYFEYVKFAKDNFKRNAITGNTMTTNLLVIFTTKFSCFISRRTEGSHYCIYYCKSKCITVFEK